MAGGTRAGSRRPVPRELIRPAVRTAPPRKNSFARHCSLRQPRPAPREIRGQLAGLASATRPLTVKPSRVHRGLVPRLGMLVPPGARQRPRRPGFEASYDPAAGWRMRHGPPPADQTASANGSLPAARDADRGVGPFHPGDVPAVIQHVWRRHPAAVAGPALIRARDQSGSGCIRGYAWCRACLPGAGCGLTWGCASLSCNSGRLGCTGGSLGSCREDEGPEEMLPNAAAVAAAPSPILACEGCEEMGASYYDMLLPVREPEVDLHEVLAGIGFPCRVLASVRVPGGTNCSGSGF